MYTNTSILHFYFISLIFYKLIFSAVSIRAAIAITICFSQKQTVYSLRDGMKKTECMMVQLIVRKMSFLYG